MPRNPEPDRERLAQWPHIDRLRQPLPKFRAHHRAGLANARWSVADGGCLQL